MNPNIVLCHLLQQPGLISKHEGASSMTPSLAALDDAPSLKQREWIWREPGEEVPRQYTSIGGRLTPITPRGEGMRLEPSLNITPKGSLVDIPTKVEREKKEQEPEEDLLWSSLETTYMEIPSTHVKQCLKGLRVKHPESYQEQKKQVGKKH